LYSYSGISTSQEGFANPSTSRNSSSSRRVHQANPPHQADGEEKRRIQKATRTARDELYKAKKAVKEAQEAARAARERAAKYIYIPAPRITKLYRTDKEKLKGSVRSVLIDNDEDWAWLKRSPSEDSASRHSSDWARQ
jgi:hypothetical protein